MKNLIFALLLFLFCKKTFSQELYTFDWNSPRVNINGQPHFKVNYYPSNANYKGDFYPDLESNPNTVKYTIKSNCTINENTNFHTEDLLTPPLNATENPAGYLIENIKNVLIIPEGVTLLYSGKVEWIYSIIIKGRLVLDPNIDTMYTAYKTMIYPTGVFESTPASNFNHSILLFNFYYSVIPFYDPLQTSTFISLGGKVNIVGSNSESIWTGRNVSTSSYYGTFLRPPFSYTSDGLPLFRMNGNTDVNSNVVYSMNQYYTDAKVPLNGSNNFIQDDFNGGGYILMRPWAKNVFITGAFNSSMVFTLGSTVNIQNSVFYDIGHTKNEALDDNVLDSNNNLLKVGKNPPDRYPITLLHNKVAVTIQNNMFMHYDWGGIDYRASAIPRSFIGAKRSFGTISGNAFALRKSISGISLLYGTEQFNISYNAFISLYTDTTTVSSYRSYPDIDYLNGGIVTTSPYSTYEGNAFEGNFKGGAIQVIPLQSRSSIAGLISDTLLGAYAGLTQDNTADYKTNNVWNNVVFLNHFFAGETEVRVRYPLATQPPLKINLKYGWYIGQRSSLTLGSTGNQANIELFYDSPYISSSFSENDLVAISNTHTGKYNAISIINSLAKSNYAFFSESFTCGYLSIKDSKFSHYSSSSSFIKKYTSQLYLSNVNGTKLDKLDYITKFYPLYNYNPLVNSITTNQLSISFKPNVDYLSGSSQNIDYIVNDVTQSTDYPSNDSPINKVVNFPRVNGLYTVLVSSNLLYYPTLASFSGPYYAKTYTIDTNAQTFYIGIDLTPDVSSSAKALSIFSNQWTKCGWISGVCKVTGKYSKVSPTPSTVIESPTGTIRSATDEVSMLTSYLSNDVTLGIKSSVNITLPANAVYKFFIYSYNADYTGTTIVDSLPLFTIKINGRYQEPYSRPSSPYQKYQKFGPFYWNSGSTDVTLVIEWASDTLKYSIPISGIEVFSNNSNPYPIPTTSTTTTGAVETSSKSTSIGTTTTNNNNNGEHLSAASSIIISKSSISILISFILLTQMILTII